MGKDKCFRAGTISSVKDKIAYGFVKKFLEQSGVKARRAEENKGRFHIHEITFLPTNPKCGAAASRCRSLLKISVNP